MRVENVSFSFTVLSSMPDPVNARQGLIVSTQHIFLEWMGESVNESLEHFNKSMQLSPYLFFLTAIWDSNWNCSHHLLVSWDLSRTHFWTSNFSKGTVDHLVHTYPFVWLKTDQSSATSIPKVSGPVQTWLDSSGGLCWGREPVGYFLSKGRDGQCPCQCLNLSFQ